jgi:hypothetical protein
VSRKKLATGIFRDRFGYRAFVSVQGPSGQRSWLRTKRFRRRATLSEMKAWREEQRVNARRTRGPTPAQGTLAADIETYLTQVAALKRWLGVGGTSRRGEVLRRHAAGRPAAISCPYLIRWPLSSVSSAPATSAGATGSTERAFRYCNTMLAEPPVRSWPIALDLGNGPAGIPTANS